MLDIDDDFQVNLRTVQQNYQRCAMVEQVNTYFIEEFLLECEIFKNSCIFSESKSKKEMLKKMKKKIEMEHFDGLKKEDIRTSIANMNHSSKASTQEGGLATEIKEFVKNLHSSEKTKLIDGIEVSIEEVLLMESRDLEFKIFMYLKLKYSESFQIDRDEVPLGYLDRNPSRPFDLSGAPILKPLMRFKFEKSIKAKIDVYKLQSYLDPYFANPKWS